MLQEHFIEFIDARRKQAAAAWSEPAVKKYTGKHLDLISPFQEKHKLENMPENIICFPCKTRLLWIAWNFGHTIFLRPELLRLLAE